MFFIASGVREAILVSSFLRGNWSNLIGSLEEGSSYLCCKNFTNFAFFILCLSHSVKFWVETSTSGDFTTPLFFSLYFCCIFLMSFSVFSFSRSKSFSITQQLQTTQTSVVRVKM